MEMENGSLFATLSDTALIFRESFQKVNPWEKELHDTLIQLERHIGGPFTTLCWEKNICIIWKA